MRVRGCSPSRQRQWKMRKFSGLYKRFRSITLGIQHYDTFSETLFFSENICRLFLQLPVLFNLNHLFEISQKTYLALKNNQCSCFNRYLTNSLSPITVKDIGNVTAGLIENKQKYPSHRSSFVCQQTNGPHHLFFPVDFYRYKRMCLWI